MLDKDNVLDNLTLERYNGSVQEISHDSTTVYVHKCLPIEAGGMLNGSSFSTLEAKNKKLH